MSEHCFDDFDRKLAQLTAIKRAWDRAHSDEIISPRGFLHAATSVAAAFGTMLLACKIFGRSSDDMSAWILSVSILMGILVYLAFHRCVPASRSPIEVLDDLISEYKPVDELGYAQLQRNARSARALIRIDLPQWVAREQEAIRDLMPIPQGPGTKFMNKSL